MGEQCDGGCCQENGQTHDGNVQVLQVSLLMMVGTGVYRLNYSALYILGWLISPVLQCDHDNLVDCYLLSRRFTHLYAHTHTHTHTHSGEAGEVHNKKELIQTARMIAKESEEVVKMARKVAEACTDKRMKRVSD